MTAVGDEGMLMSGETVTELRHDAVGLREGRR